jgi:hypothetical protein
MTNNQPVRSLVSRALAATILTGIYCFGLVGASTILVGASSTSAYAQRGDGRGRGRGASRGRGRGDSRGRGRGRGRGNCIVKAGGVRICL